MSESEDIRGLQLTLGVYVLIFAMKIVVYFMSGVLALMAVITEKYFDGFAGGSTSIGLAILGTLLVNGLQKDSKSLTSGVQSGHDI